MYERYTDETAYSLDNLEALLDSHKSIPPWCVDETILQRIQNIAQRRASSRGEESALDNTDVDCLIATNWTGWAENEFGLDTDDLTNQVGMGVLNARVTADRDAILFNDTVVLQTNWLRTGDGRKTQIRPYIDTEYDGADEGDMWVPRNATDYIAIISLSDEFIHGDVTASEAM